MISLIFTLFIISVPFDTTGIDSTAAPVKPSSFSSILFPKGAYSFADEVYEYDPGALGNGTGDEPDSVFQFAPAALGTPDFSLNDDSSFVSLGHRGFITLAFRDNLLLDGPGPDLRLFFADQESQSVRVWISADGALFHSVGLADASHPEIDIAPGVLSGDTYSYVKIKDNNSGEEKASSLGADIDAVGAIHTALYECVPADSLFLPGDDQLKEDAFFYLLPLGEKIRTMDSPEVRITVHSDDQGSDDFLLLRTEFQADAIRNYLRDELQINHVDYRIFGMGKREPLVENESAGTRCTNRRVEIQIR